jgi:hypothetical protein
LTLQDGGKTVEIEGAKPDLYNWLLTLESLVVNECTGINQVVFVIVQFCVLFSVRAEILKII